MMDTILNIGLNDEVAEGMIRLTQDARFVYDSYRRLVQMFGSVVMSMPDEVFEEVLTSQREAAGVKSDSELSAEAWKEVTEEFKEIFERHTRRDFPTDPYEQLQMATEAVFRPGTESGRSTTATLREFLTIWALASTSSPWSSAIWARTARPASRCRVMPPLGSPIWKVTSSSTPKAKTSSPVSASPSRLKSSGRHARALRRVRADRSPVREALYRDAGHGVYH
jgi:hypothetical protein